MSYEELKREISERSITQLPGLLQHIVGLCAVKPVFKDKEAMLRFVEKAFDSDREKLGNAIVEAHHA